MRVWAVRRHGLDADYPDVAERLTSLDGSFLRIESANAHMHVAWSAVFKRSPKVGLEALRRGVAARLERTPRFRRRLAYPAPGLGEPYWVDDHDFDVTRHVVRLGPARETQFRQGSLQ